MSALLSKKPKYENNPLFVATNGFELLFNKAKSVGILLAVLSAVAFVGSAPFTMSGDFSSRPDEAAYSEAGTIVHPNVPVELLLAGGLIVCAALAFLLFIAVVFKGVSDYTAAQIAKGKETTLGEALRGVFANFWPYTWVLVIVAVKTLLWTFLLVIPGIIMAVRYSLSGVAFFEGKATGNAAVKRSLALTKDAWFTTFGSQTLLNILTLGLIQPILDPGTNAVLYRQFSAFKDGEPKPAAHLASKLTVLGLIILVIIVAQFVMGIGLMSYDYYNQMVAPEFI